MIERFTTSFEPKKYEDTYRAELLKLIRAKAKGKTITAPEPEAEEEPPDLMAALHASLDAAKKRGRGSVRAKQPPARRRTTRKRKTKR